MTDRHHQDSPDDERLIALETRIAYLEDTVSQLSELLFERGKVLTEMDQRLRLLKERFDRLLEDSGLDDSSSTDAMLADERPPHY